MKSADGQQWAPLTDPIPVQTNEIASAQPLIAATGKHIVLVYAWDATETLVPDAHHLQIVRSEDDGSHWTKPTPLIARDSTDDSTDWPMDLHLDGTTAALLFQRLHPGHASGDSIATPPATCELAAAVWQVE